jgi:hypothetical protein
MSPPSQPSAESILLEKLRKTCLRLESLALTGNAGDRERARLARLAFERALDLTKLAAPDQSTHKQS